MWKRWECSRGGWAMSWRIPRRGAALALALAALCLSGAERAAAFTLVPPKPDVLFGVSDQGTTEDFEAF